MGEIKKVKGQRAVKEAAAKPVQHGEEEYKIRKRI
jgi:hypothetical protein